jgi:hypothetical protein
MVDDLDTKLYLWLHVHFNHTILVYQPHQRTDVEREEEDEHQQSHLQYTLVNPPTNVPMQKWTDDWRDR